MKKNQLLTFISMLLTFFVSAGIYAQTVNGTVTSEDGPLPGATVQVKDTDRGTSTDFDGNYSIEASSGDVLVISFVGFATQEIPVGDQDQINVTLLADSELEEIIVTGYRSQARGSVTGSVATVNVADAVKVPVSNAAEALQGRVAGLTVINSGQPGAAPVVRIRGYNTPNNNDPLYVIDGVQTTDAFVLNSINPNDIENISVLKDGAASIYGARASNGVILITTKTGKGVEGTKISVDVSYGVQNATNLPTLLTAQQHGEMLWQSYANDGVAPSHIQYGSGASPVIPSTIQGITNGKTLNVPAGGTDWFDAIFDPAPVSDINVSVASGSESSNFLFSINHLKRDGIMIESSYERIGVRLNSDFQVSDNIRVGQTMNVTTDVENNPGSRTQEAFRMSPLIPLRATDGTFGGIYVTSNNLGNVTSPYATLKRSSDDYAKSVRAIAGVYTQIDLTEDIYVKTSINGQFRTFMNRQFDDYTPEAETNSGGALREQAFNQYEWNWTTLINWEKTIGNHAIDAFAGYEAVKNYFKGHQMSRTNFLFDTPEFVLLSTGTGTPNVDYASENWNTLAGYFFNASYSYKRKYLFTGSIRSDKTSRFSKDQQDDLFPSASVAWVIDKENFFNSGFFNSLKLRVSYGEIGNQSLPASNPDVNISALSEDTAFYSFTGARGNVSTGAALTSVGNPNLTWETSVTQNLGIDFSMLNSKLSGSFELFKNTTKDLIVRDNSVISTTAIDAGAPFVNLGEVQNTGADVSLNYSNETNSGLKYNFNLNISSYKNEVLSLVNDTPAFGDNFREGSVTRTAVGEPISHFYGKPHDGLTSTGRLNFIDSNGDGVTNDSDRTIIGNPHPDYTFGLNMNFAYENWDLSLFLNGSQGNEIYNWVKIYSEFPTFVHGNRVDNVLNAWTPSNTNTSVPALSTGVQNGETAPNSYMVEDGSYTRLKSVQLGYNFPAIGMFESMRAYVSATNLFTITDYSGMDPEVARSGALTLGVDTGTYPAPRIVSVGLNLNF